MKSNFLNIKPSCCCLLCTLTIISSAVAQDSLAQYHPLSKGNIWIYYVTALPSRTWYEYREVDRDSIIDGKSYRIVNETYSMDTLTGFSIERYDTSTGCYYSRSDNTDILEDSTFTFTPNSSFGGSYDCKVFANLDTGLVTSHSHNDPSTWGRQAYQRRCDVMVGTPMDWASLFKQILIFSHSFRSRHCTLSTPRSAEKNTAQFLFR